MPVFRRTGTNRRGRAMSKRWLPSGLAFMLAVAAWDGDTKGRAQAPAQEPVLTLERLRGDVHGIAYAPDGQTLATGSSDGVVKLWDVTTGKERQTLHGHRGNVCSVAFAPDGNTLATGSLDQTVRVWDVRTGQGRVM